MKLNKKILVFTVSAAAILALASCGTKKAVTGGTAANTAATGKAHDASKKNDAKTAVVKGPSIEQINYLRRVNDNAVYVQNIVSKVKCTINTGRNDISVGGSLHMKKDAVIRIQITPFGLMEAGRLEFTPDYVLFLDRIHKEYFKATYSDVDFLQQNGLDFYALQALFWNQLFVPGMQKTSDSSLKNFTANLTGTPQTDVKLTHGKMDYVWSTDSKTALIKSLNARYSGAGMGANTSVTCSYAAFKALGSKQFPTDITLTMNSKAVKNSSKMMIRLQLNGISNESGWEEKTSVSSKYKQVSVREAFGKLGNL